MWSKTICPVDTTGAVHHMFLVLQQSTPFQMRHSLKTNKI